MKTLPAIVLLLLANLSLADYAMDPVQLPTKKWRQLTVEQTFEEVAETLERQTRRCYAYTTGFITANTTNVVVDVDLDTGVAEIFTEESTFRSQNKKIRIYALGNNRTQIIWTGLGLSKRTMGRQIEGWLSGKDHCNGKK